LIASVHEGTLTRHTSRTVTALTTILTSDELRDTRVVQYHTCSLLHRLAALDVTHACCSIIATPLAIDALTQH
jgi:hypothetical protein